jgi:hypothetical protein
MRARFAFDVALTKLGQADTLINAAWSFLHRPGTPDETTIIESLGSGVALLNFDNDVWLVCISTSDASQMLALAAR